MPQARGTRPQAATAGRARRQAGQGRGVESRGRDAATAARGGADAGLVPRPLNPSLRGEIAKWRACIAPPADKACAAIDAALRPTYIDPPVSAGERHAPRRTAAHQAMARAPSPRPPGRVPAVGRDAHHVARRLGRLDSRLRLRCPLGRSGVRARHVGAEDVRDLAAEGAPGQAAALRLGPLAAPGLHWLQQGAAMQCFQLTVERQVAHLVLNRPEAMNTMHPLFWRELDTVLTDLHRAPGDARVLVISSTGKHFSAGMALDTFGGAITLDDSSAEGRAAIFDLLGDMQATFTRLETLRMPVIAAIQGGCVGGAVDLVTACCLRYASSDAFFCVQEINIGMVADVGTLQRLPKLLPMAVVKELAYTGRRLPATEAKALGLVNDVFDTQQAMLEAA